MATIEAFISHESALEFWRHHDLSMSGGIRRSRKTSVGNGTASMNNLRPLLRNAMPTSGRVFGAQDDGGLQSCLSDLQICSMPLHVMVGSSAAQRRSPSIVTHLYKTPLPSGSFCKISETVYVASPELTLCQLADSLNYADLLGTCLEFCSGYAINEASERGFDDRPALTSAERLNAYIRRFSGRRGAKRLRPLLRYAIDDSRSPMESKTLMLLCLPSKLGGCQLPMPEHNVEIPITERARTHTHRKRLLCDLYWPDFHLDVECDSTRYHSSKRQLGIDSNRRIVLDAMHYSYVGITTWQLEDQNEFADVVQAIRRAMGLKLRNVPDHVAANREALRQYLTSPSNLRKPLILR